MFVPLFFNNRSTDSENVDNDGNSDSMQYFVSKITTAALR